jgi:hypothetical protein
MRMKILIGGFGDAPGKSNPDQPPTEYASSWTLSTELAQPEAGAKTLLIHSNLAPNTIHPMPPILE